MRTLKACAGGHKGYLGVDIRRGHARLRTERVRCRGAVVVVEERDPQVFRQNAPRGSEASRRARNQKRQGLGITRRHKLQRQSDGERAGVVVVVVVVVTPAQETGSKCMWSVTCIAMPRHGSCV
jgi:hypothetical protein